MKIKEYKEAARRLKEFVYWSRRERGAAMQEIRALAMSTPFSENLLCNSGEIIKKITHSDGGIVYCLP